MSVHVFSTFNPTTYGVRLYDLCCILILSGIAILLAPHSSLLTLSIIQESGLDLLCMFTVMR